MLEMSTAALLNRSSTFRFMTVDIGRYPYGNANIARINSRPRAVDPTKRLLIAIQSMEYRKGTNE